MKTLVLLATILAFCTMHVLGEYMLADNVFQDELENDAGFFDEEPKKREAKGRTKFSGWFSFDEQKYKMTLAAALDMTNGLIAGEAKIKNPLIKENVKSVGGTIQSMGKGTGKKVTFVAESKAEEPYTFTGMYKDGKIKGTYSVPLVTAKITMQKTESGTWEGTITEGPGKPKMPYKNEELILNLDKDGSLSATGKDHVGKFSFTGTMDSNGNAEVYFHYKHDPTNSYLEKMKFNEDMTAFTGTIPGKKLHGRFELTEM